MESIRCRDCGNFDLTVQNISTNPVVKVNNEHYPTNYLRSLFLIDNREDLNVVEFKKIHSDSIRL